MKNPESHIICKESGLWMHSRSMVLLVVAWLVAAMLFTGCSGQDSNQAEPSEDRNKPNILVLLADDLGYGDLSCYGHPAVHTPNLDRLAQQGSRYTQFYAGSAVCTPSRASLLTGLFPYRFNILGHFYKDTQYLPDSTATIPKVLRRAGYYTAHIGKWHLGGVGPSVADDREGNYQPGPAQHGFDDYVVMDEGPNSVRRPLLKKNRMYRDGAKHYRRNDRKLPPSDRFLTDYQADWAMDLVGGVEGDAPFYIQVWFDAPHKPYEPAPGPAIETHKELGASGDQLLWRSMMVNLDHNIGRILDFLDSAGLSEGTLVAFTSDNGPAYQGSPGPFKGGKTDIHEGGIRVPLIIRWPGVVPADRVSGQASHMVDFLPTFAGLAGVSVESESLDGMDLLPHWADGQRLEHKPMFWHIIKYSHYQNQGPRPIPHATTAVVDGHWKLLGDGLHPTELFDLSNDHRELYNVLDDNTETREQLIATLTQEFSNDQPTLE